MIDIQSILHNPLIIFLAFRGHYKELKQIQWLPDGKHISFVYRGTLYIMPVETPK